MSETFNVYCDESCHLENDGQKAMVLGAVWCKDEKLKEISTRIREIKARHNLPRHFEVKWTKVSESKVQFYLDLIDFFFDDDDLHFRGLVVPDKTNLNHEQFYHSHDDWYYKMYFSMLKTIFDPKAHYRIYIDIKDTLGHEKVEHLHNVLCHNAYDFSRDMIQRIKRIHSHESELLQVADLFIGAMSYLHRDLSSSTAKLKLIDRIKFRSGYRLTLSTMLRESKFNLFVWEGR
jgi:hypothetical protein